MSCKLSLIVFSITLARECKSVLVATGRWKCGSR